MKDNEKVFSQELLDRCISCGYCLPVCPTYEITKDEASSPRGRINIMRAVQNNELTIFESLEQSSYCLGCRACEVVCPAGVEYGHMLEEWRDATWKGTSRPLIVRGLLFFAQSKFLIRIFGLFNLRNYKKQKNNEINLMLGCFERGLYPGVSSASSKIFKDLSIDPSQGCCGALHAHNGELDKGRLLAKEMGEKLSGVILTTSGGCAAHLSDVLGKNRVREVSQYLHESELFEQLKPIYKNGKKIKIGLQDSCHLRNGLAVFHQPREILKKIGEYIEVPGASECCGAAGSYSLVRPKDSRQIVSKKVKAIDELDLDYLVTVNPGCQRQMSTSIKRGPKVIHIVELVQQSLKLKESNG